MRKIIILAVSAIMTLAGCSDYLDLVPEKDMTTISSIFEKKGTAVTFLHTCYVALQGRNKIQNSDIAMAGAGEYIPAPGLEDPALVVHGGWQGFQVLQSNWSPENAVGKCWGSINSGTSRQETDNMFTAIRYCNTFINNIDKVYDIDDAEKRRLKGEAIALKAIYYYHLVRMYGPIPLIKKDLDASGSVESMIVPREPLNECFNAIDSLFEMAIPMIPEKNVQMTQHYGRLHQEAAMVFRAKSKLLQASPLFTDTDIYSGMTNMNGEKLFTAVDKDELWRETAEIIDQAIKKCEASGLSLHDEENGWPVDSDFKNTIMNLQRCVIDDTWQGEELIWGSWVHREYVYYDFLPRYSWGSNKSEKNGGSIAVPINIVEQYFTEHGLPINLDKTWDYDNRYTMGQEKDPMYNNVVAEGQVLKLHLRREPRFYAHIAADRCYWYRDYENQIVKPYKNELFGTLEDRVDDNTKINLTGYWCKKSLPTEVTGGEWANVNYKYPAMVLRMGDLYLMQAEAWNEAGDKEKAYAALNKVRDRAGLEGIKESWETHSKNPGMVNSKEGLRQIIRWERNNEMSFEGQRFWDYRRWKIADKEMNKNILGWNVFGEDAEHFYNMEGGVATPKIVYNKNRFQSPRDYFAPIPRREIVITGTTQNYGW